jgi:uncharacterized integral membrane protein
MDGGSAIGGRSVRHARRDRREEFTVWLVRSLLVFVAIAGVLAFAIVNVDHRTSITLFTRTYIDLALNVVLFCAALFGALVAFLLMVFREFSLRASIRRLRRDNLRLDDELNALRNLPLSGLESSGLEPEQQQSGTPAAEA